MIYIVYPVMLIILFWGCRIYGRKSWNEEFLSLEQTKALLGFAALCIMFHHIGQKNSASWIDRKYYTGGLEFFVPIGNVLVAFFTFCSGYGLFKRFKGKKYYLNFSFLRHHILTFVFLGYLVAWIFLAVRLCITLEFYLIHGLYVELFSYSFDGKADSLVYIKNSLLFSIIVFTLSFPSALLIKILRKCIRINK